MPPNLRECFLALPPDSRRRVHQYLCARALEVWERFAADAGKIRYMDSVVGLAHTVDLRLPADAFQAAFGEPDEATVAAIDRRYLEPITALQDDDVEFPDEIGYAYYAIYNAFERHARGAATDDWVICNQALSSVQHREDIRALMRVALHHAELTLEVPPEEPETPEG